MYANTGISGQVGSAMARRLLADGRRVRAVVRDAEKGKAWAVQGCEVAVADMNDASALTAAFRDTEGVFILPPPEFDPSPGFPEALRIIDAVNEAIASARTTKAVVLSTVGAQATQPNLLTQRSLMERALRHTSVPVTFLRPAWFMENFAWDIASARDTGVIASFLQPLDRAIPMVATADVGNRAAELIQETWQGGRVVELEGARRYSPNDVASAFAKILGRSVRAEAVPRETWGSLFISQGMNNPLPRIQMLDGFNEGWIDFEGATAGTEKGMTHIETVLKRLVDVAAVVGK
jgi:NAD(P)H dehydrogenase (quinone)